MGDIAAYIATFLLGGAWAAYRHCKPSDALPALIMGCGFFLGAVGCWFLESRRRER